MECGKTRNMEAILTSQPQSLRSFIPALTQEHGPLTQLRCIPSRRPPQPRPCPLSRGAGASVGSDGRTPGMAGRAAGGKSRRRSSPSFAVGRRCSVVP